MAKVPEKKKKEPISGRVLFIVAGVIWGLVLGPDFGLGVARFLGGLNWPFIAGTLEWPDWADWVIAGAGVLTGLVTFFVLLIVGRNVGDRFEYSQDMRLGSGNAVPWAVIAVGVTMGAISVMTFDDRQKAVRDYVDMQKAAQAYLLELSGQVQRFRSVHVDWPGNGADGIISLTFRGKHRGNYMLRWQIWEGGKTDKPLLEGKIGAILNPGDQNTELPLPALSLLGAWQGRDNRVGRNIIVDQDFTLRVELVPEPSRDEWKRLPGHEADALSDGSSILIDRASAMFPMRFEQRGRSIFWSE